MKKLYTKPVFVAEAYMFNASIAKCDIDIDTTDPIVFYKGVTGVCKTGDGGHVYGGQNGQKGTIVTECNGGDVITLFNDGDLTACQFDWDGRANIVAQTGDNFAVSMYGNDADYSGHTPAYELEVFLS